MPTETFCLKYWDASDWLTPVVILEQWCKGDQECWRAKTLALVSACERGEVSYQRSDGKTFNDPVFELFRRQLLLIERASFEAWVIKIEGCNPLNVHKTHAPVASHLARPAWLDSSKSVAEPQPVLPADSDTEISDPVGLTPQAAPGAANKSRAVTSHDLIQAFRKHVDPLQNKSWWEERLSNPGRYQGLESARMSLGRLNRGGQRTVSTWCLADIATWLITKKHMSRERVIKVIEKQFPDYDVLIEYL